MTEGRDGSTVCVDPSVRRMGVGARLLKEAESQLEKRGLGIIACLVYSRNSGSIEFLTENGYRVHEDVIYMSKRSREDI